MQDFFQNAIFFEKILKSNKSELVTARQRNQELKEKAQKLEEENKQLKEKFENNELEMLTRKNELNSLLETLQRERKDYLVQAQKLQIFKEEIDSINTRLEEMRPIKEQLSFKRSVTECLHDLLVKTRLRIAESDDILQELHDYLSQLEYDVDNTRTIHEQGVVQWQDQFLQARLREADVILEFDKLKREIAIIKNDLEEKIVIDGAQELLHPQPKLPVISDNPLYDELKELREASLRRTADLQDETDFLRQQLKKLDDLNHDCQRKMKMNEEIKMHLLEVKRSIWSREYQNKKKIEDIEEKYLKLVDKMAKALHSIQKSIEDKDMEIAKIEERIKKMETHNCELESEMEKVENHEEVQLEDKKKYLEKQIAQLNEDLATNSDVEKIPN